MKAKYLIMLSLLSATTFSLRAEETTEPTASEEKSGSCIEGILAVDLVNQYIWRGLDCGDLSLQPTLGLSYKGLSLAAWGSVGLTDPDDIKELDLILGYSIAGFNVSITDYWFSDGSYFQYKAHKTTHVWEANVGYDFGFASVQWFTNFAGNDGLNNNGKRAYSSYFELSAPFRLGGLDWKATVGAVPYATSYYLTNGFAVTNIGLRATKDFVIKGKYHLPVYAGLTANPHTEKLYLIVGASFSL